MSNSLSNLSRRQFLKGAASAGACATAAGLAGCGSSKASKSGDEGGTIELTYWYCWTDQIKESNEERVKEFNETIGAEKGIHVTAESQGSYDDLNSKLRTAFTANEEPDVCVMVVNSTRTFADGGMIQPIADLVSKEDLDDFWGGLMENCYSNDELYGVPYLRSTPMLYYNKTLFEKAGLPTDKAPETWDEMVTASDALAKVGVGGYGFYSYIWVFTSFAYANGGALFGDDISGKEATFNERPAADMASWFKDNVDNHNFSFCAGSNGSDTLNTYVANQQVAMWATSTADLTNHLSLAEQGGYEINAGFMPRNTQNKVPTGGCNLVMTSRITDARREAAGEFINFMTSKDSAIESHLKTGYLLTRKSAADDSRIKEAYAKTPQYQVAFDQLEYAVGDYMNDGYTQAAKVYTDTMDQIMSGSADEVQSRLDDAKKQADPILAD